MTAVARGQVIPIEPTSSRRGDSVYARVRLDCGVEVAVVSLRLLPAPFRLDFWSPQCWKDYADNRRKRRRELEAILQETDAVPASLPLIVGGDFNVPSADGVLRLLEPRLHDTFLEGGRGWGHTALNKFPVFRVDQIWASGGFRAVSVAARKTRHSDHRMVICDLMFKE